MEQPQKCEELQSLLEEGARLSPNEVRSRRRDLALISLVFFLTNLVTFFATLGITIYVTTSSHTRPNEDWTSHRPLYRNIDSTTLHEFNFSAFSLEPSQYTAAPSEDVEKAWRSLGVEYHTFLVPESQGDAFGISDEHVVIPSDAPGTNGKSGYAVDMEAMHQLHCLNLLRKGQFYNYEYYSSSDRLKERPSWAFLDPPENIKGHINHCIDALRERIMCAADSEVLPYYWRDQNGLTISDFAVTRQCKNFDSLREWANANQIEDWGLSYRLQTPSDAYLASDILG